MRTMEYLLNLWEYTLSFGMNCAAYWSSPLVASDKLMALSQPANLFLLNGILSTSEQRSPSILNHGVIIAEGLVTHSGGLSNV